MTSIWSGSTVSLWCCRRRRRWSSAKPSPKCARLHCAQATRGFANASVRAAAKALFDQPSALHLIANTTRAHGVFRKPRWTRGAVQFAGHINCKSPPRLELQPLRDYKVKGLEFQPLRSHKWPHDVAQFGMHRVEREAYLRQDSEERSWSAVGRQKVKSCHARQAAHAVAAKLERSAGAAEHTAALVLREGASLHCSCRRRMSLCGWTSRTFSRDRWA